MTTPRQLKALYEQGRNISAYLREAKGIDRNTAEIIEISYDLQTGSYIAMMAKEEMAKFNQSYTKKVAETIRSLCRPSSILEAGVGEATTLSGVMRNLGDEIDSFGFDLSWSRVAYGKGWLKKQGIDRTTLCTGDLFHIPFSSDSVDVVYTSHSIEPNGGYEEPILKELFRVTREFLILLEPGYELAGDEARKRMEFHGYCKNLKGTAESLGCEILEHKLFHPSWNPLNPTAITIIRKGRKTEKPSHVLACPRFKTPLNEVGGMMFSPEALVVYPVIGGIPCLRIENGILASKYMEVMTEDRGDL